MQCALVINRALSYLGVDANIFTIVIQPKMLKILFTHPHVIPII